MDRDDISVRRAAENALQLRVPAQAQADIAEAGFSFAAKRRPASTGSANSVGQLKSRLKDSSERLASSDSSEKLRAARLRLPVEVFAATLSRISPLDRSRLLTGG